MIQTKSYGTFFNEEADMEHVLDGGPKASRMSHKAEKNCLIIFESFIAGCGFKIMYSTVSYQDCGSSRRIRTISTGLGSYLLCLCKVVLTRNFF